MTTYGTDCITMDLDGHALHSAHITDASAMRECVIEAGEVYGDGCEVWLYHHDTGMEVRCGNPSTITEVDTLHLMGE